MKQSDIKQDIDIINEEYVRLLSEIMKKHCKSESAKDEIEAAIQLIKAGATQISAY
jgi:hypothetical protein